MLKTNSHHDHSRGRTQAARGAVRVLQEHFAQEDDTRPEDIFNDPRVSHQQKMKTLRNWDMNQKALLRAAAEDVFPANDEKIISIRRFSPIREKSHNLQEWIEEKWESDGL